MLNTDSYRSSIAFRLSQLTDPTISEEVKLHLADVLGGLAGNLIGEIERLRSELEAAEKRAIQWEVTAQAAEALAAAVDDAITTNADAVSAAMLQTRVALAGWRAPHTESPADALLRAARAGRRYRDAEFFADALRDALNTPGATVDQGRAAATVQELLDARAELDAALKEWAALEATE